METRIWPIVSITAKILQLLLKLRLNAWQILVVMGSNILIGYGEVLILKDSVTVMGIS